MKIKKTAILVLLLLVPHVSNAQTPTITNSPKVENNLEGDLDYKKEQLVLTQTQVNREELMLGTINTDGSVHLTLPEFDIKALHDGVMQPVPFNNWFMIDSCKGRDMFAKTPYDGIYSSRYKELRIKKYGQVLAFLEAASSEEVLKNRGYDNKNLVLGSRYFWLYMDRKISYKDECIKTSFNGAYDIEVNITANIEFQKGWNLVAESLLETQESANKDDRADIPRKIHFSNASLASKEVKWFIKSLKEAAEIKEAKRLFELPPITKEKIEAWLPDTASNLTLTSYEFDKKSERGDKVTVALTFEEGKKKMEVWIGDGAKNPESIKMVNFSLAMQKESNPKASKEALNHLTREDAESKKSQLLALFKDRVVVSANAENMTADELWGAVKSLNVSALAE